MGATAWRGEGRSGNERCGVWAWDGFVPLFRDGVGGEEREDMDSLVVEERQEPLHMAESLTHDDKEEHVKQADLDWGPLRRGKKARTTTRPKGKRKHKEKEQDEAGCRPDLHSV